MLPVGPREAQNRENNNQKVYPQPMDDAMNNSQDSMETLITKIFQNISSLKRAYMQLQGAHTPYDPDKIQASDKVVIQELMKLSELKHSYRDNHPNPAPSSPQDARLVVEIHQQQGLLKTYEVMVKKFQSQIQSTDTEILQLKQQIQDSHQKKAKLEKKLKQRDFLESKTKEANGEQAFSNIKLIPSLFVSVADTVQKAIHDFSKALINMMKAAGWDLDAAANSIITGVAYGKRAHKKYAFESHICYRIFSGFQEESFLTEPFTRANAKEAFFNEFLAIRPLDPLDMLSRNPDSVFGKFCRSKYLLIMHPKMETSLFGNLDQRNHVAGGGHPRTPFYLAFLKLAKSVWLLHRLAYSFDPKVRVFQVKTGSDFSEAYMQSVVKNIILGEGDKYPKIGFMTMPGFMIGDTIVRSNVYLSDAKYAE